MNARFLIEATCLVSLLAAGCERPVPVANHSPYAQLEFTATIPSGWSEPVNLGPVINSPSADQSPALSPDGLSLYFASDRPGTLGGVDLWVSRRASRHSDWGTPVNLGAGINSPSIESGPNLSPDGHLLFFQSNRPGGQGSNDIYVSHRADTHDDFGWDAPVNLGPDVNTRAAEVAPWYQQRDAEGPTLYFDRGPSNVFADIYKAPMTRDGHPRGPATLVAEVSTPDFNDGRMTVRADGRQIIFFSDRPGGLGVTDLWSSTRRSVHDAWSPPVDLGAPLNSPDQDLLPFLSHDGRTLFFTSTRTGGLGGFDIWMATRMRIDDEGRDVDGDHGEALRFSDWSAPVNLGPVVNSPFIEQGASVSKNGLSLYFHCTGCPGSTGADIYVSQRLSVDDPWGAPQRLGPNVNTTDNETAPTLSPDGHLLFFARDGRTGLGATDLYVSRRRDKRDDLGWEPGVNLGSGVNTAANEAQASLFEDEETENTILYFSSNRSGGSGLDDIYTSTLGPDGTFGPAVPVPELNSSSNDRQPAVRRDGLEIFLGSDRPGTLGGIDLWVSTRATTRDVWSTPLNLGPVVNSTLIDARPALSFDGTTLYFQSTRPGAVGCTGSSGPCVFDLWVTTRTRLDDADDGDDRRR